MRLLSICTEFPPGPGGVGTHAYQIARHLEKRGWEVQVLTPQDYALESEILAFNDQCAFPITRLRRFGWPAAAGLYRFGALSSAVRRFRPDILLASGEKAVWLVAAASQIPTFRRLPWAAVWHGMVQPTPSLRRFSCWAYNQAGAAVAVSHYSQQRMLEMGVRAGIARTIHNGADPEQFGPIPENQINAFRQRFLKGEGYLLLTVGNVTERKGQEVVIRALPEILAKHPQVHYLIAGLPTLQPQLEQLAGELGVGAQVHFAGRLSTTDLRAAYNACDLFVMTSRHSRDGQFEGYGIAAVEAALCGKPAVVSNNSGLAEAILPGETGLVAQENDPQSTAQAVLKLIENPDLCRRMGAQARQRALQEQTWSASAGRYDQVLKELAGNAGKRQANP